MPNFPSSAKNVVQFMPCEKFWNSSTMTVNSSRLRGTAEGVDADVIQDRGADEGGVHVADFPLVEVNDHDGVVHELDQGQVRGLVENRAMMGRTKRWITSRMRTRVGKAAHAVVQEAQDAGVWVFGGGLRSQRASIVATSGVVTDGPYPETKEVIGGFSVVDVPSREEALMGCQDSRRLPLCAGGTGDHARPGRLIRGPVATTGGARQDRNAVPAVLAASQVPRPCRKCP